MHHESLKYFASIVHLRVRQECLDLVRHSRLPPPASTVPQGTVRVGITDSLRAGVRTVITAAERSSTVQGHSRADPDLPLTLSGLSQHRTRVRTDRQTDELRPGVRLRSPRGMEAERLREKSPL